MNIVKKICRELQNNFDYYNDVYYEFIIEAVENTVKDLNITDMATCNIATVHKHIKENYI